MKVVGSGADLGNHALQTYNIKQYWFLMSVLSVKKFNPDWKRVLVVDDTTASFLQSRNGDMLGDEIIVKNFHHTEHGDLYSNDIYSGPKLYAYSLFDEDILMLDTDVVFTKEFIIPDRNKICGRPYNHANIYRNFKGGKVIALRDKWQHIDYELNVLENNNLGLNYMFEQESVCLHGAPLYVPGRICKYLSDELLEHVKEVESLYQSKLPNYTFYAIEEEYPLAAIAKRTGGIGIFNTDMYRHGFVYEAEFNLEKGFEVPEKILDLPVFEIYIKKGI